MTFVSRASSKYKVDCRSEVMKYSAKLNLRAGRINWYTRVWEHRCCAKAQDESRKLGSAINVTSRSYSDQERSKLLREKRETIRSRVGERTHEQNWHSNWGRVYCRARVSRYFARLGTARGAFATVHAPWHTARNAGTRMRPMQITLAEAKPSYLLKGYRLRTARPSNVHVGFYVTCKYLPRLGFFKVPPYVSKRMFFAFRPLSECGCLEATPSRLGARRNNAVWSPLSNYVCTTVEEDYT